jgi:hypothetical protein
MKLHAALHLVPGIVVVIHSMTTSMLNEFRSLSMTNSMLNEFRSLLTQVYCGKILQYMKLEEKGLENSALSMQQRIWWSTFHLTGKSHLYSSQQLLSGINKTDKQNHIIHHNLTFKSGFTEQTLNSHSKIQSKYLFISFLHCNIRFCFYSITKNVPVDSLFSFLPSWKNSISLLI